MTLGPHFGGTVVAVRTLKATKNLRLSIAEVASGPTRCRECSDPVTLEDLWFSSGGVSTIAGRRPTGEGTFTPGRLCAMLLAEHQYGLRHAPGSSPALYCLAQ